MLEQYSVGVTVYFAKTILKRSIVFVAHLQPRCNKMSCCHLTSWLVKDLPIKSHGCYILLPS